MSRRPLNPVSRSAVLSPREIDAGIGRLEKRLADLHKFDPSTVAEQFDIPEVDRLKTSIDDALSRTFGADSHEYESYKYAAEFDNGPFNYAFKVPIDEVQASLRRSKDKNIAVIETVIENLRERRAEVDLVQRANAAENAPAVVGRRIFIVHGRDEGPREAVARFLERLEFEPIILHEQANQGRTVIEKIEAYSDVGFAVILLTPDDEGGLKGEAPQPRARQNVLLELGYFLGHLKRHRVCTLKLGDVEIPSDWRGVVDEPFDTAGAWRQTLARELAAAGYEVDWNKVMRS
jgi:predicted nucleotide-binding protein